MAKRPRKKKEDETELSSGPGKRSRKMSSFWMDLIGRYDESRSDYFRKASNVTKRYRDERALADQLSLRRMNMLWAYIKIMRPAVYSKKPIPIIDRKFLDHDPVARLSSMIAERSMRNEIQDGNFHSALKMAVLDRLLIGQGIVWIRYEKEDGESVSIPGANNTSIEDSMMDALDEEPGKEDTEKERQLESTGEQITREAVPIDYINYKDFYMLPCEARTWDEVQAVAKHVMISRDEAVQRFGDEIGVDIVAITNDNNKKDKPTDDGTVFDSDPSRNLSIYEIWDKTTRKVYWVSEGYQYLCKVVDDPLELTKFFPCPKPLFSTMTNNTLVPVIDYLEWQDQAVQIDELTTRIAMLTKACRVAGTYDAQNSGLARLLDENRENSLIPVDNWSVYAEKGGIPGSISFLPLKEIQGVIETLMKVRQSAMQDLDTVTGVNDVMRGTSDSRETLGGIRLKNNNTGTRLSEVQEEIKEFCREAIVIMTEIQCKIFSTESLTEQSGILFSEELDKQRISAQVMGIMSQKLQEMQQNVQQNHNVVPINPSMMPSPEQSQQLADKEADNLIKSKIDSAVSLLRKDVPRRYRIDIETDSTIYADAAQEREDSTQFVEAFMKFMQGATQIVDTLPEALPLLGKMLQFAVRKFRAGRDLEYAIDEFVDKMSKKAQELADKPKQNPDDAKMETEKIKQQGEIQKQQLQTKAQAENDARDAQRQAADDSRQQQIRQQDAQMDMMTSQFDQKMKERQFNLEMEKMDREAERDKAEHDMKMQEMKTKHAEAKEKKSASKD